MADSGRSNHASAGVCAPAVPRDFRGTDGGRQPSKSLFFIAFWWAHKGSNLGPLPCEGNALPLSYAPGIFVKRSKALKPASDRQEKVPAPAIYEVRAVGVKPPAGPHPSSRAVSGGCTRRFERYSENRGAAAAQRPTLSAAFRFNIRRPWTEIGGRNCGFVPL
jgi:hypothetical protein